MGGRSPQEWKRKYDKTRSRMVELRERAEAYDHLIEENRALRAGRAASELIEENMRLHAQLSNLMDSAVMEAQEHNQADPQQGTGLGPLQYARTGRVNNGLVEYVCHRNPF